MIREAASVRLFWSLGPGTCDRRRRRLAAGLLAVCPGLGLARRHLGFVFRLLAGQVLAGARLDFGTRLGQLFQSRRTPLQFFRDRHPVGNIGLVRCLGLGRQRPDLGL
jgi:hypothetical protein